MNSAELTRMAFPLYFNWLGREKLRSKTILLVNIFKTPVIKRDKNLYLRPWFSEGKLDQLSMNNYTFWYANFQKSLKYVFIFMKFKKL